MEFRAIKITGLMGKVGLVAEHSKPVQSRRQYIKNNNKHNKNATTVLNILNS
jgi:hypothetical protein